MNKNIQKRAEFIASRIKGEKVIDFGSEDYNWGENMHARIEEKLGRKIVRADLFGEPDIKADFNKKLPIKDSQYDCVISFDCIEHLERPLDFLRECKRILNKKGKIIVATANASSLDEIKIAIRAKIKRDKKRYGEHLYTWNKHNFIFLFQQAGFEIEKVHLISWYWEKNILFKIIARLFPVLRPTIVIEARKD